jgi:DNA-binding HxlR family transcriptional regulator
MKANHGCAVQAAVNTITGKWKVLILWHLSRNELRFAQLRRKLRNISEKVLTQQLRQLEADGVIEREISGSVPPAVTYSLTVDGKMLLPIMETLCDWGSLHFKMKRSFPRQGARTASSPVKIQDAITR